MPCHFSSTTGLAGGGGASTAAYGTLSKTDHGLWNRSLLRRLCLPSTATLEWDAMESFEGGCLCGSVRLIVRGDPKRIGVCHCLDCRKHHGALFQAYAVFIEDAVRLAGATGEFRGRHFCLQCGSSVFSRYGDGEVEIPLGTFDATDRFKPTYELWTIRRERWLPTFDMDHYDRDRHRAD